MKRKPAAMVAEPEQTPIAAALAAVKAMTRGEKVIAFIERYCVQPEGDNAGAPIKLLAFQKRFILEVYDNPLGTHTAYLSMARKNGKTALIAGLLLCHIAGPEAVPNSQIVSGANSKDQAAIVFDLAVKAMGDDLRKRVRVGLGRKTLLGLSKNVLYRALAAEGKTGHGKSPVLAILDEVGEIEGPTSKFVSAITTSQGAYKRPLLIAISTQAATDQDMFSLWLDGWMLSQDPQIVCHVYQADADCQLDDRAQWAKANPAMGYFRSEADIVKLINHAKMVPSEENETRRLILNQRVELTAPFVTKATWDLNAADPGKINGKKVWLGLDLSAVKDLTSCEAVDEDGGIYSYFWLPDQGLLEKSEKDHVSYVMWKKQGYLMTTPGPSIEFRHVAQFLRGLFDQCDVQAVGFDRALMNFLRPWLTLEGFSDAELEKFIEVGQGTITMTPALREMEVKLLAGKMKHGANPILNMCRHNATIVGNEGARKFNKQTARGRIDGMTALANAFAVMPVETESDTLGVDSFRIV